MKQKNTKYTDKCK